MSSWQWSSSCRDKGRAYTPSSVFHRRQTSPCLRWQILVPLNSLCISLPFLPPVLNSICVFCLFKQKVYILFSSLNMQQGSLYGQGGAVHLTLTQSSGLLSHCPTGAASCTVTLPRILSSFVYILFSAEARNRSCVIRCFKIP